MGPRECEIVTKSMAAVCWGSLLIKCCIGIIFLLQPCLGKFRWSFSPYSFICTLFRRIIIKSPSSIHDVTHFGNITPILPISRPWPGWTWSATAFTGPKWKSFALFRNSYHVYIGWLDGVGVWIRVCGEKWLNMCSSSNETITKI